MRLEYFELIDAGSFDGARQNIRCEALVPCESLIFQGHFPDFPLLPGVLMIEMVAQAAGFLFLERAQFERMPFLAAVENFRFRKFAFPGAKLIISARLNYEGSGYSIFEGSVLDNSTVVANGEVRLISREFPKEEFRNAMIDRATSLGLR